MYYFLCFAATSRAVLANTACFLVFAFFEWANFSSFFAGIAYFNQGYVYSEKKYILIAGLLFIVSLLASPLISSFILGGHDYLVFDLLYSGLGGMLIAFVAGFFFFALGYYVARKRKERKTARAEKGILEQGMSLSLPQMLSGIPSRRGLLHFYS